MCNDRTIWDPVSCRKTVHDAAMQAPTTTDLDAVHLLWIGTLPPTLSSSGAGLPMSFHVSASDPVSALAQFRTATPTHDVLIVDASTSGLDPVEFLVGCQTVGVDLPVLLLVPPGHQALGAAVAHLAVCDIVLNSADLVHALPAAVAQVRARHDLLALFRGSRAAQDRLRTILEFQPAVTGVISSDGAVAAMNQAGLTLLGSARDQVVGTTFTTWLPPDQRYDAARFLRSVCQGESGAIDLDVQQRDGTTVGVRLKASPLHSGDTVTALVTLFERVTSNGASTAMLAEAENRAAALAAQVDALAQQHDLREQAVREARTETQRVMTEHLDLQARYDSLEAALVGERTRLSTLADLAEAERDRAEAALADERARAAHLAAQIAALESRAAGVDALTEALAADRDALVAVRDQLAQAAADAAQRCTDLLDRQNRVVAALGPKA